MFYKNKYFVMIYSYITSLTPFCMKILTEGINPGNQGLKLRDDTNTDHTNLRMTQL